MLSDIIDFYYFSGTGNTFLVVKKMCDTFVKKGIDVNLYRLEKSNPRDINPKHTIGLGFPVACQTTYPFVWNFMKSLPEACGTDIFMVDTMYMFSGGIVGPLRNVLKGKGYIPIGAKEIPMPCNFFIVQEDENKNKKVIEKGIEQAEKYACDIISGKSKWGRIPVLSDMMYLVGSARYVWKTMRKWCELKVENSKCTKCGECIELCPVANIEMDEYPVFGKNCQICLRCISFCPEKAIYPKTQFKIYSSGLPYPTDPL